MSDLEQEIRETLLANAMVKAINLYRNEKIKLGSEEDLLARNKIADQATTQILKAVERWGQDNAVEGEYDTHDGKTYSTVAVPLSAFKQLSEEK